MTFLLYYQLIAEVGEVRAAIGSYLTPIFALFYGVIMLGEQLTITAVAGRPDHRRGGDHPPRGQR
jgi:drug/metabolite transporter (DMT)-like permease